MDKEKLNQLITDLEKEVVEEKERPMTALGVLQLLKSRING